VIEATEVKYQQKHRTFNEPIKVSEIQSEKEIKERSFTKQLQKKK